MIETLDKPPLLDRTQIPGPRGHFLLGSWPGVAADMLGYHLEATRRHGDIVRFNATRWFDWYLINHPDDVEQVLQGSYQTFSKGSIWNRLKMVVGNGLLTSEGELWRTHRRLMQPAFHRDHHAAFAATMTQTLAQTIERWKPFARDGRGFDVVEEMMTLTLKNAAQTLFSTDLSHQADEMGRELGIALEHVNFRSMKWLSRSRNRRFQQAMQSLDAIISGVIRQRRALQKTGDAPHGDLLSRLMEIRDEKTGEPMSAQQLHDEVMTFIFTGHETTAIALSWTWYLLAKHPDAERRLHQELTDVLGTRAPTLEDLPNLPYTRMVFQEAMRLYPPVWGIGRQTTKAQTIRGYRIPPRALLTVMPYVVHRNPQFWDEPETFDPERFTPERSQNRPRYAYIPFGGGPRQCIGNHFAMIEGQLVLATIAQHFRLKLAPHQRIEPAPWVTLRPRFGIQMTLQPREL